MNDVEGSRLGFGGQAVTGVPVIDLHVHYYTDRYIDAVKASEQIHTYRRADGRLVARWRIGVALTVVDPRPGPAQRIEMMDELGIGMQVLSVPSPNAYFLEPAQADRLSRDTNEAFAEIVRAHPSRFSSLAMAPMHDTERALQVLDHAIDELGMAGIHILSNIDGMPFDDPSLDPFWESANDRGLLVYVHPTVPDAPHHDTYSLSIAVGFFNETPLAVARLTYSGVFERWPRIRWVFSHLGGTLPMMVGRLDSCSPAERSDASTSIPTRRADPHPVIPAEAGIRSATLVPHRHLLARRADSRPRSRLTPAPPRVAEHDAHPAPRRP